MQSSYSVLKLCHFGTKLLVRPNQFQCQGVSGADSIATVSLYVITFTATFISILVCARDHYQPASWVFGDTTNSTGWPSTGFAFILALMNGVFCFIGTDCAAHLAEEIPNPSRNVPRAILWPILIGFMIAWPYAVACVASISDIDGVLGGDTGFPLLTIYYQATGSKVGATVLLTMFIVCFFGCMTACLTTCSRTIWAVSRDNALPYSKYWMRVSPTFQMPVNATCLSGLVMSVSCRTPQGYYLECATSMY